MGLKDLAIFLTANLCQSEFFRTLEDKLVKAQRIMSRRKEGGANWYEAKIKVARLHEKITNTRNDYLHKTSSEIVKNYDMIGLEDLSVGNMLKNHYVAKAISEV